MGQMSIIYYIILYSTHPLYFIVTMQAIKKMFVAGMLYAFVYDPLVTYAFHELKIFPCGPQGLTIACRPQQLNLALNYK